MAKLAYAKIEPLEENPDGGALSLYFEGKPTKAELLAACLDQEGKHPLSVDTQDPYFAVKERPNVLSKRGKLRRYQAHPIG